MKKLFIFEGPDGCGKSTQVKLLAEKLSALGKKVIVTREPGGTPFGEEIRNILLNSNYDLSIETQAYLFAAARRTHNEEIAKWINDGYTVICDRHILSSLAYQSPFDEETKYYDISSIFTLNYLAMKPIKDILYKDLLNPAPTDAQILYFDVSHETILNRINNRSSNKELDNIEKLVINEKNLNELLHRYDLALKKIEKNADVIRLDTEKSIEEIHQDIINLL